MHCKDLCPDSKRVVIDFDYEGVVVFMKTIHFCIVDSDTQDIGRSKTVIFELV